MTNSTELKENSKKGQVFLKIAKASVYVLVFLLPLFFLPFTANVLEFQKQTLLFFLVLISLVSWLAYILTSYKLEINKSFVNIAVALLVLAGFISTLFSIFRYGSFWGNPLSASSSFLTLLAFALLYFIIVNLFRKEEITFLLLTLFVSGFLAALIFIFHVLGRFLVPFDFAETTSFNTLGSVNSLAIYLTVLLILITPLLFFVKRLFKIILGVFALAILLSLVLINFKTAWLVFLAGTACLFALGTVSMRKTRHSAFITLLMAFLIIGLFFTFFQFSLPGTPQVPLEISITQKASFGVLTKLPLKHLILGTGPGTFFYDWAKYKPVDINQTLFWGLRFERASSEVLDRIISTGILGLLAFFFLAAVCFKQVFTLLLRRMGTENPQDILDRFLLWGVFAGFAGLLLALFLYPANLSILLIFWLLVSFSALLSQEKARLVFDLQASSVRALGASFAAVLILILGIGLAILYGQKYAAEVRYYQGLKAWQSGAIEKSAGLLLRAASLNPKIDFYWRDLSQMFLFNLNQVLADASLSREEMTAQAQGLISDAANSASQASQADQQNVANWNVRGFVYRNMIGILGGAEDWAIGFYDKAKDLEPTSPYIFTEMGRIYLLKSDLLAQQENQQERSESLGLARQNFEKAIELKSDYAPAHYLTAMTYLREEKLAEAVDKLEATKLVAPFDTGLAFQLGLVYYNDGKLSQAKAEFERAVLIDANHSNSRYFLGLILDRQGQKQEAISQFAKIEELDPANEEVKKILANLRAGKQALEGVVSGQPPIEEKPEEQLE